MEWKTSIAFRNCVIMVWLFVTVMMVACGTVKPPTIRQTTMAAEGEACLVMNETREGFEKCRKEVLNKYHVDGGAR